MKTVHGAPIGAAIALAAGAAFGGNVYSWEWNAGDSNTSSAGGAVEKVETTYRSGAERLQFKITFSNQISDGFTLAFSDGPNPKGHSGELALVYFDASDFGDVKMTAYAYNGRNDQSSWEDGSKVSGIQSPDQIVTTTGDAARSGLSAMSARDEGSKRIFEFDLDAGFINAHTPSLPGPLGVDEWFGIGFAEQLGMWLHPITDLDAGYDSDGYLNSWSGRDGFIDVAGQNTTVPAPGALALAGFGGLLASRRRR
ncbi:MAG: PEP-CTERM sorting domain-containing protein [Planctomycetota bacterium]